jgi:hypothetical protein
MSNLVRGFIESAINNSEIVLFEVLISNCVLCDQLLLFKVLRVALQIATLSILAQPKVSSIPLSLARSVFAHVVPLTAFDHEYLVFVSLAVCPLSCLLSI